MSKSLLAKLTIFRVLIGWNFEHRIDRRSLLPNIICIFFTSHLHLHQQGTDQWRTDLGRLKRWILGIFPYFLAICPFFNAFARLRPNRRMTTRTWRRWRRAKVSSWRSFSSRSKRFGAASIWSLRTWRRWRRNTRPFCPTRWTTRVSFCGV